MVNTCKLAGKFFYFRFSNRKGQVGKNHEPKAFAYIIPQFTYNKIVFFSKPDNRFKNTYFHTLK